MTQPPENHPSKAELLTARISVLFQDKRVRAGAAVAILAIIALVTSLIVVSNNGNDEKVASNLSYSLSPETDYVFQPANSTGPDPFTPSFANYTINLETETLESGEVSGASTGLYGGTGENACDIDKLIAFLQANPDIGAAWAEVQGITPEELEDFIRGLTPAVLLQNTLVTNHGYADGEAIPFLAVLEAGTAVLVDEEGIPRARCACGNPLLVPDEPEEGEEPTPTTEEGPTPTTEEGPTPTPPEETPETACPEPNPPYGIHKNADDDWELKTEEGVWVWKTAIPGWENVADPLDVYDTEADVPGYIEECFPCPEEEDPDNPNEDEKPDDPNGKNTTSTYEKDDNGKYKTSKYILNTFSSVRLTTYVTIKPITTNEKPKITPIEEDDTEDYDDNEYDDGGPYDKSYDGCFPPCPEDGEWGWDLFGPFGYTWVDPDGYRWYWTESGWVLFEPIPIDSSDDGEGAEEDESSGVTYTDYRELPGWSEDCEECPPWGWEKIEDGSWRWIDPGGRRWHMPIGPSEEPWEIEDGDGVITISDISDLPGFIEDCHECPEWGWHLNENGGWEWHGPNGLVVDMEPDAQGAILGIAPNGLNVLIHDYPDNEYPDLSKLPGFDEDCHECPEWGWQQNTEDQWEWHSPGGTIYSMIQGEDGMIWGSSSGDSVGRISDLPGYIEECEDCPEWGWEQKADGVFVWEDPLGREWFPQPDGTWYHPPEDRTLINYQYLPGWIRDCHCDAQTWGWVDVNGDGIEEWYGPDGTVWGEFGGIWRPVGNINDEFSGELSQSESSSEITVFTRLPGWGDDCFEGPELTTEQPTPTPEPTPTFQPTPTPTPLPERPARATVSDTSCKGIWVSWFLAKGTPAPDSWNAYLTVESDLGTETVMKSQTVPPINVTNLEFLATEFWPEMASGEWPWLDLDGAQYELVVYRVDAGVENSPSTLISAVVGVFAGPNQCTGGGT